MRVQAGQMLEVELVPTEESRAFRAEPIALAIVHEDDAVLVVDNGSADGRAKNRRVTWNFMT